ncbi:MAG: distal tail protein Dit [Cetobacterium sp.]
MYFIYNGIKSTDMGLNIKNKPSISPIERNIETVEVDGRNGELIFDKGNYKNLIIRVECILNRDRETSILNRITNLRTWLQKEFDYKKLYFSDDLGYYYEAVCINKLDIDEVFNEIGEGELSFTCKPLKVFDDEEIEITSNNQLIYNPYNYPSEPVISVFGNGDIKIYVNNKLIDLRGVQEQITIDNEEMVVVKGEVLQNEKLYSDFVTLECGENYIRYEGTVNRLVIKPNWKGL